MGRKADPRGKDRPRTIVLSGDVAEIAEKLAASNKLSATLSELLRNAYGFGDQIAERERELEAAIEQRKAMQLREEQMIADIEAMKDQKLKEETVLLPNLESRLRILTERYDKARRNFEVGIDKFKYARQMTNIQDLIDEVHAQISALGAIE